MKTERVVSIVLWVTIAIMVTSIIGYMGIMIANNCVAKRIEKNLLAYELPVNTTLVDSLWAAEKLVGNGNGMQYMGCILVESELNQWELEAHYSAEFDSVEVHVQEGAWLDFIRPGYSFEGFSPTEGKTYYAVACFDTSGKLPDILDFDIRGH